MKYHEKLNPLKATGTDNVHRLSCAYYSAERKQLLATDSRILASIPLQTIGEDDVTGLVSTDALKAGKRASNISLREGETILSTGASYPVPEGSFPAELVARMLDDAKARTPKDVVHTVTLDARLLRNLADAITTDGIVTLILPADRDLPVYVKAAEGGGEGLIMPLSSN